MHETKQFTKVEGCTATRYLPVLGSLGIFLARLFDPGYVSSYDFLILQVDVCKVLIEV